jgi:hypothetical protein
MKYALCIHRMAGTNIRNLSPSRRRAFAEARARRRITFRAGRGRGRSLISACEFFSFLFFFFFFRRGLFIGATSRSLSRSFLLLLLPPLPTYNISNGLSGLLESRERSGTELPDSESDPDADRRTRRAGNRCSVGSCSRTAEPLMTQLPLSPCPVSPQSARQSAQ